MNSKGAFLSVAFFSALMGSSFGFTAEEPAVRSSGVVTRVEVREHQVMITAWPENGDPAACRELGRDDFQVEVDGQQVELTGFLPIDPAIQDGPRAAKEKAASVQGMRWVILIDELHHSCPTCWAREIECNPCGVDQDGQMVSCPFIPDQPVHRRDAYESARRMLKNSFQPGDLVLIATSRFWPMAETAWLSDPALALEVLDRLEKNVGNRVRWDQALAHTLHWYEGMLSFINALGQIPGPKDLLFPTCHFALEPEDSDKIRQLSGACAKNEVVLHTVDLTACGSSGSFVGPLAAHLGGQRFTAGQGMAGAVEGVRRVKGCRFLLAFRPIAGAGPKLDPDFHVSCRKPGFNLLGPTAILDSGEEPNSSELSKDLLLLADYQKGLVLDVSFLPQEPGADSRSWKGLAPVQIQRLSLSGEQPLPEKLILDLVIWQRGGMSIERHHIFSGKNLAKLLSAPNGHTVAFNVEMPSGETFVSAILRDDQMKIGWGAVARRSINLPTVPEASKNGLWFPVRREAFLEEERLWIPDLSGVYDPQHPPMIIGRSCAANDQRTGETFGRFFLEGDAQAVEVRLERTLRISGRDGCQWLLGKPQKPLTPGRWRFQPLVSGVDPRAASFSVEIRPGG